MVRNIKMAKIGKEKIAKDPNEETKNGRILVEMAERQEMTIANTVDKCIGTITRERVAMNNTEKAVLDYILICEQMKLFLDQMTIDENRVYVLTKYSGKKGKNNMFQ